MAVVVSDTTPLHYLIYLPSVTGRIKTSHLGSNQNQPPWVLRHLKHRCAPCGKFNLRPARACSLAVTGSFWHRG